MKILIIGLGSMGKRRFRNLKALKEEDIIAFDLREDRRKEVEEKYGIRTFANFEEAMKEKPDVFIISVPPDIHLEYQLYIHNHFQLHDIQLFFSAHPKVKIHVMDLLHNFVE